MTDPSPVPLPPADASALPREAGLGAGLEEALETVEAFGDEAQPTPIAEHVIAFDRVHRLLQMSLAEAER